MSFSCVQSPALRPLLLSFTLLAMPRATKNATMMAKEPTVAIMTYHTIFSRDAVDAENWVTIWGLRRVSGGNVYSIKLVNNPFLTLVCLSGSFDQTVQIISDITTLFVQTNCAFVDSNWKLNFSVRTLYCDGTFFYVNKR